MLDIIVIIGFIWAVILGMRRGFIVQLCHLLGLYVAILIAPSIASPVGSLFMDDPRKAYIAGIIVVVAFLLFLVWILAPLLRKFIIWKPAKWLDTILGGALNLATAIIIISALFSTFDRINVGNLPRVEKIQEFMDMSPEEREQVIAKLGIGNGELREYFHHRYVDYVTLDASASFGPLARFGDKICPTLSHIDGSIRSETQSATTEFINDLKH